MFALSMGWMGNGWKEGDDRGLHGFPVVLFLVYLEELQDSVAWKGVGGRSLPSLVA